jgi:RimJ/RimL family protein N-acetyltransferase
MASQSSDILSQHDNELFETPDLSALNRTLSSASASTSTTAKRRFSKVWDHTPVGKYDIVRNHNGKSIWQCRYCLKEYIESGGTTIITGHLKEHGISISSTQETRTASIQNNITDAFHKAEQSNQKRRCLSTIATHDLDPAVIEQLYVRWITTCSVSFRMATLPEFRALLCYLNPEIDNWLPHSIPTIRTWTLRTFEAQKHRIKREVQSALSRVHFTVDLWTSPNALAILGMIAHYTSESGQLEHSVLALRELDGKHTGQNIASSIMQIINDYGVASKVGYFMMDNADNNDTMMEALSDCKYERLIGDKTGFLFIYNL